MSYFQSLWTRTTLVGRDSWKLLRTVLSSSSSSLTSSPSLTSSSGNTGSGSGISHHHKRQVFLEETRSRHNPAADQPVERIGKHKGHQLLVHRIPKHWKPQHLTNMFLDHTGVQPTEVEDLCFFKATGKAHVTFRSTRHAGLAFDTIDGTTEADKSGKLQKKVFLRNGSYVRVRKMVVNHRANNRNTPNKTPSK